MQTEPSAYLLLDCTKDLLDRTAIIDVCSKFELAARSSGDSTLERYARAKRLVSLSYFSHTPSNEAISIYSRLSREATDPGMSALFLTKMMCAISARVQLMRAAGQTPRWDEISKEAGENLGAIDDLPDFKRRGFTRAISTLFDIQALAPREALDVILSAETFLYSTASAHAALGLANEFGEDEPELAFAVHEKIKSSLDPSWSFNLICAAFNRLGHGKRHGDSTSKQVGRDYLQTVFNSCTIAPSNEDMDPSAPVTSNAFQAWLNAVSRRSTLAYCASQQCALDGVSHAHQTGERLFRCSVTSTWRQRLDVV